MTKRTVEYVVQLEHETGWTEVNRNPSKNVARMIASNCRQDGYKPRIIRRETIVRERVVK